MFRRTDSLNTPTWNRLPQDVLIQGDEDSGMAVGQGPQPQGQVTLAKQVIRHVHPVCNEKRRRAVAFIIIIIAIRSPSISSSVFIDA